MNLQEHVLQGCKIVIIENTQSLIKYNKQMEIVFLFILDLHERGKRTNQIIVQVTMLTRSCNENENSTEMISYTKRK